MKYDVKKLFGENVFYLANRIEVKSLEAGAKKFGGATKIGEKIYSNINEKTTFETEKENIIGLIIPSTINTNISINNKKYVDKIENTLKDFGKITTNIKSEGSWYSDTEGTVIEENNIILFNSNGNIFDMQLIKYLAEEIKTDMKQEAVTIVLNDGIAIV